MPLVTGYTCRCFLLCDLLLPLFPIERLVSLFLHQSFGSTIRGYCSRESSHTLGIESWLHWFFTNTMIHMAFFILYKSTTCLKLILSLQVCHTLFIRSILLRLGLGFRNFRDWDLWIDSLAKHTIISQTINLRKNLCILQPVVLYH